MTYKELATWLTEYHFTPLTASDPCHFWIEKDTGIVAQIHFTNGNAELSRMTKTDMVTIFSIIMIDYFNWGHSEQESIELAHARMAELGFVLGANPEGEKFYEDSQEQQQRAECSDRAH